MNYSDRKFIIINYENVTDEMINNSNEISRDVLRHSVSGVDRVILKWDGDTPEVFDGMETLNHSEIRTELSKNIWTEPIE